VAVRRQDDIGLGGAHLRRYVEVLDHVVRLAGLARHRHEQRRPDHRERQQRHGRQPQQPGPHLAAPGENVPWHPDQRQQRGVQRHIQAGIDNYQERQRRQQHPGEGRRTKDESARFVFRLPSFVFRRQQPIQRQRIQRQPLHGDEFHMVQVGMKDVECRAAVGQPADHCGHTAAAVRAREQVDGIAAQHKRQQHQQIVCCDRTEQRPQRQRQ
jgi:hypothetical protein